MRALKFKTANIEKQKKSMCSFYKQRLNQKSKSVNMR